MTTTKDAERYAGSTCTLDGRPARVVGRLNEYATVATIPDGPAFDYAWATVARIMGNGGAFKS